MAQVASFSDIQEIFLNTVEKTVWCNMATVDTKGRPRSRVIHPMWEGSTGWIMTGRQSLKAKHLEQTNHISLAYVADPFKPILVEARADWVDNEADKQRIWDLFKTTPEPYGYDPQPFFGSVDNTGFGVLKITPWQIQLYDLVGDSGQTWKA